MGHRTHTFFKWLERGYLVFQILLSLGIGAVVRAILMAYSKVPPIWILPLWLLSSALVFRLVTWIGTKFGKATNLQASVQGASSVLAVPDISGDVHEYLKNGYSSPVTQQTEDTFRAVAAQLQPNEREAFYLKLIGVGGIEYGYLAIWAQIYASQVKALMELNRRLLPMAEVNAYYDKVKDSYPDIYGEYPFDFWFNFFKANMLVIQHPSNMVEITLRGKDFLKYLIHRGLSADDRRF